MKTVDALSVETITKPGHASTPETEKEGAEVVTEVITTVGKKRRPGRPRRSKYKGAAIADKKDVAT